MIVLENSIKIIIGLTPGFRVIIMTQVNSQVNTRVFELLQKFKIKKTTISVLRIVQDIKIVKSLMWLLQIG